MQYKFDTETLAKAEKLLKERKAWKFADNRGGQEAGQVPSGFAGMLVLDTHPEPYQVIWNENEWDCECQSKGRLNPCVHLAALLVKLGELPRSEEESNLLDEYPESANIEPLDHLFIFPPSEERKPVAVTVMGESGEVEQALAQPIHPVSPAGLQFKDLSQRTWRIAPGEVFPRKDGRYSLPRHPGTRPAHGEVNLISNSKAAEIISGYFNHNEILLTPHGHNWLLVEGGTVHVRFKPLPIVEAGDLLCEPEVLIRITMDSGAFHDYSGGVIISGNALFILDSQAHTAARADGMASSAWFIRLLLSRPALSVRDIRARLKRKQDSLNSIVIEEPNTPDTLPVLSPRLVLDIVGLDIYTSLHPRFHYDTAIIHASQTDEIISEPPPSRRPIGLRDWKAENELIAKAESILSGALSWRRGPYSIIAGSGDVPIQLEIPLSEMLAGYGTQLLQAGIEIRLEDRPVRAGRKIRINAANNGLKLNLQAAVEDENNELLEINLDSMLGEGFVLTERGYFILDAKALEQLNFLIHHGMNESGFLSTSPANLSLIDAVYALTEADEQTAMDMEKKRAAYQSLMNFTPKDTPPPPSAFHGTLRAYQLHGYAWLLHLHRHHLGACLADDMGLGKTIQTLAFLSRLHADKQLGAILLVGPVVTLNNWLSEIERFFPELPAHHYHGTPEKRSFPEPLSGILLVSYQTLRSDAEKFLEREWDIIILDEAHYVKNASSQTFKAIRSLKAAHRISLTGTPLENHLGELWAQLSFLNPGLLGTRRDFERTYVRPVEREDRIEPLERLNGIVAPFILRRRKEEVLDDLPPKEEIILRCEMTDQQAAAYRAMSELYFQQIKGLLAEQGPDRARIKIFSILSKLRLLAIHPPLAGEQFANIASSKITLLDSLMEEILSENHKALIFSQFLGVLDRTEKICRRYGWEFRRLTGSTRDRKTPIAEFANNPSIRVFLLSLRAGGVGINLTAANYVILLDPWWNPAVESQAIDRACRIGQHRPVTAYKLITAGTIEEKVLELQKSKKHLAASVLGDSGMPNFSEADILSLLEE
ncbi:MAG: hypothetical protein B0D92_08155 [Spirochaeta sp. LUC14_002_19_P3]|nr:MAG: hypothetical protein B0D92_08155 [Spirochaeta sp. LUC14_002_19_P3]